MTKILILASNSAIARPLEAFLRANTFNTNTAGTIQEALKLINEVHFNLMIIDSSIPNEDVMFMRRKGIHLPVLYLCDIMGDYNFLDGLEWGSSDFILKPFKAQEFKFKLQNLLCSNLSTTSMTPTGHQYTLQTP